MSEEVDSTNFALTEYSEDEMRRPTPRCAVPLEGLQMLDGLLGPLWKEDRPTMNASKDQPHMTAGLESHFYTTVNVNTASCSPNDARKRSAFFVFRDSARGAKGSAIREWYGDGLGLHNSVGDR